MKPELENSPIRSSRGDAPSTLRETSVMCKQMEGCENPQRLPLHQPDRAATINLETRFAQGCTGEKLSGARFLPHGYSITVTRRLFISSLRSKCGPLVSLPTAFFSLSLNS